MSDTYELLWILESSRALEWADYLEIFPGFLSVAIEDAYGDTELEQPVFDEPGTNPDGSTKLWDYVKVIASFKDEKTAREVQKLWPANEVVLKRVPNEDWVRKTQAQFEPIAVTPEFWIVPSWHEVPQAAKLAIRLDPGLAFGTGAHATTSLCLRAIAEHTKPGFKVLDYGCGSGILGIACALHGASEVVGVDVDEAALQASMQNATNNGVSFQALAPYELEAERCFDQVFANILCNPLQVLAPLLCGHAKGGELFLSGILETQVDVIQKTYAPYVSLSVFGVQDGWVAMHGRVA